MILSRRSLLKCCDTSCEDPFRLNKHTIALYDQLMVVRTTNSMHVLCTSLMWHCARMSKWWQQEKKNGANIIKRHQHNSKQFCNKEGSQHNTFHRVIASGCRVGKGMRACTCHSHNVTWNWHRTEYRNYSLSSLPRNFDLIRFIQVALCLFLVFDVYISVHAMCMYR